MNKKVVCLTPDQLGYRDRGKMKWMGLLLSDHSEALNQIKQEQNKKETRLQSKQSISKIGEILFEAYHTDSPILIQINTLQNGSYFKNIKCHVIGTFENTIYLRLKNDQLINIFLDDIRYTEFLDTFGK